MAQERRREAEGDGEETRGCRATGSSMKAAMMAATLLALTARTSAFVISSDSASLKGLNCAFTAPALSSGLHGAGQRKAVCLRQKSTRDDGATEEEVQRAMEYYKELMRTRNNGKGYWMDDFFPFANMLRNIQEGLKRNFEQKSGEQLLKEAAKEGLIDLRSSPFTPISDLPDTPMPTAKAVQPEPEAKKEVAKAAPEEDDVSDACLGGWHVTLTMARLAGGFVGIEEEDGGGEEEEEAGKVDVFGVGVLVVLMYLTQNFRFSNPHVLAFSGFYCGVAFETPTDTDIPSWELCDLYKICKRLHASH